MLPFKNDSNDSANIYLVNGLMESLLDNLQKIEDVRVVSRTSVEKYRENPKTIPQIARELNVSYLVEGSGQKIGDRILLSIQLIDGLSDRHLWSEQYSRQVSDIFDLQVEVAQRIAVEIEAIITPEEAEQIEKVPTDNLVAYEYFLKGLDLFYRGERESLDEAIRYYKKAIEHDPDFARAFAAIAIAYYSMDAYRAEKKFVDSISHFADQSLLLDPKLAQGLIAKALYHMSGEDYQKAVPFLEKALEYNPNSALVINILSDFYTRYAPDTEKYLEYALKGIGLDITSRDSVEASFICLHLSNAFIQAGFVDEAGMYIDKSLEYDPGNLYAEYVRAYILFARDRDLGQTRELLIKALNKDPSRFDILQEAGKICYYQRDYESAYTFYKKFLEIRDVQGLVVYRHENAKIAVVMREMGLDEESDALFRDYMEYAENDQSVYKHLSLAMYHANRGDPDSALEHLELFSGQEHFHYWTILFLEMDPLVDPIRDHPEFSRVISKIKVSFWKHHRQIRESLEQKELL